MTSSLRLLPVLSTLFLLACGDSTGPGDRPDAGTPPAADSGQTNDAGSSTGDGGTADGGATDAGTDGGTQPAPAAPTLELFDSFLCWGDVLATGVAGEDGHFSIRFPADPNASVSISARARRGTRVSDCSADWLSYVHDGRAPTVQSVTPARDATGVSPTVALAAQAQATDSGGRRSTCSPTSLTYVHDSVAPTVASVTPAPDATDVASDAPVRVTLSEPGKGTSSDFSVTCGGTRLSGTVAFSGTQLTFTPASALPLDVSCTATLAATAADLAGNTLAAAYSWSFTMKPSPPPLVSPSRWARPCPAACRRWP